MAEVGGDGVGDTTSEQPPGGRAPEESGGAQMKVQTKTSKLEAFLGFLYNKETGAVLGRKGLSWFKIFIFYVIFYVIIFGFFFMLILIFYQSVDMHKPRLTSGAFALLGGHPGLGFHPTPDKASNPDSGLIWYNPSDQSDVDNFVNLLKAETMKEEKPVKKKKGDKENIGKKIDCDDEKDAATKTEKDICQPYFNETRWGDCTPTKKFGYDKGTPCVLIRLNKIIGWKPEAYGNWRDIAQQFVYRLNDLKEMKKPLDRPVDFAKYIWIDCKGTNHIDDALMGPIKFYPDVRPGLSIPFEYFPYEGQPGYLPPFVMIQFQNPTRGVLIQIQCKAYNPKIKIDSKEGLGSVNFEILIDGDAD